jgi:hypothetical protein
LAFVLSGGVLLLTLLLMKLLLFLLLLLRVCVDIVWGGLGSGGK